MASLGKINQQMGSVKMARFGWISRNCVQLKWPASLAQTNQQRVSVQMARLGQIKQNWVQLKWPSCANVCIYACMYLCLYACMHVCMPQASMTILQAPQAPRLTQASSGPPSSRWLHPGPPDTPGHLDPGSVHVSGFLGCVEPFIWISNCLSWNLLHLMCLKRVLTISMLLWNHVSDTNQ